MEVETSALANYMCTVCRVLTYTFISAALAIFFLILSLEASTHNLSMFCIISPDLGRCSLHSSHHGKLYLNTCSPYLL